MDYDEIPTDTKTPFPDSGTDPERDNMILNKSFDEYLDYIDKLNNEDPSGARDYMLDQEPYVDPDPALRKHKKKHPESHRKSSQERPESHKKNKEDFLESPGSRKKLPAEVFISLILVIAILGGTGYALIRMGGLPSLQLPIKQDATTEAVPATDAPATEEVTEEEPVYGPYATKDYILHSPHTTDNTIVFDSNPYSLRYAGEKKETDDSEPAPEPTLEDLYPAIVFSPVEGSLNSTSPDPTNIPETQQMTSRYMVLIDLSDDSIVAKRDSDLVVYPASMTKVLTVLTAADLITDLDDTYVVPQEAIQYAYTNDCSAVGFVDGETVTVKDLIYGTIVCSGGDAAIGLALYCCGSVDAFVEKMNEKVEELGLSSTAHFTNPVGIFNEDLHCTMEDMAVILATAMQNDLLKEVLNTRKYRTTPDPSLLSESARQKLGITLPEDTAPDSSAAGETPADASLDGQADASLANQAAEDTTPSSDAQTDGEEATTEEEIPESLKLIGTTGIEISNWFMRRIEDKNTGGEVLGAKTGFVNAAGFCCASYYKSASGREYVCVTGDTYSSWRCIYDHVGIYRSLAK